MDEHLRILVLCYEYPPVGGGGGVGAQQYAEAWAAGGHQVSVLTSWDSGLARSEEVAGVEVIRVRTFGKKNRATATNLSMFCYLLFGFFHLLFYRRRFRGVDVINTHFSIPTGPLGFIAEKLLSVPNVLTIIGGDIYDPTKRRSPHRSAFFRAVNRFIIKAARLVVAISSDTKKRAQEHYGIKKKIHVINYGFDAPKLKPATRAELGLKTDIFYLIAVGRLVARKGFEYLVHALSALPQDVELLIAGDGPLHDELTLAAKNAGVSDRVTLLGYLPRHRVLAHLQAADCFVLSSIHEGLGIVVQEAMCVGRPIVSTNDGGQVDLVKERRNGLLVPPADAESLASAIHEVYSDQALAVEMANNNKQDILRCRMSVNSNEYISLFKAATATRPKLAAQ